MGTTESIGGKVVSLSVLNVFNPEMLMPTDAENNIDSLARAGSNFRTNSTDLPRAVRSVIEQTRVSDEEPFTFIVSMPPIPKVQVELLFFRAALSMGNASAIACENAAKAIHTGWFEEDSKEKSARALLDNKLTEIIGSTKPEDIPNALRVLGGERSVDAAAGLEHLFYEKLINFIDAGSAYREVPKNVRIALIVGEAVYSLMLARGAGSGYSTLGTAGGEASLGSYSMIPSDPKAAVKRDQELIDRIKNETWSEDPLTKLTYAALVHADINLSS